MHYRDLTKEQYVDICFKWILKQYRLYGVTPQMTYSEFNSVLLSQGLLRAWLLYTSSGDEGLRPIVVKNNILDHYTIGNIRLVPRKDISRIVLGGTGSRSVEDLPPQKHAVYISRLALTLDKLLAPHPHSIIVSGMARGFDRDLLEYAISNGYDVIDLPANWDKYKKAAGYRRNADIVKKSTQMVSAWDHKSKGTRHALSLAEDMEVPITHIEIRDLF